MGIDGIWQAGVRKEGRNFLAKWLICLFLLCFICYMNSVLSKKEEKTNGGSCF